MGWAQKENEREKKGLGLKSFQTFVNLNFTQKSMQLHECTDAY